MAYFSILFNNGAVRYKKLILLVTLLTSMSLNAQSDYTANWSVEGITSVVSLRYDLDIGSIFIGAHGGIGRNSGGRSNPV